MFITAVRHTDGLLEPWNWRFATGRSGWLNTGNAVPVAAGVHGMGSGWRCATSITVSVGVAGAAAVLGGADPAVYRDHYSARARRRRIPANYRCFDHRRLPLTHAQQPCCLARIAGWPHADRAGDRDGDRPGDRDRRVVAVSIVERHFAHRESDFDGRSCGDAYRHPLPTSSGRWGTHALLLFPWHGPNRSKPVQPPIRCACLLIPALR